MKELILIKLIKINEVWAKYHAGSPGSGGNPGEQTSFPNPFGNKNLLQILEGIIGWLIGLAIPLAALLILIGGYQIMFADGSPEKIKTGKNTIIFAVAGLAIIIFAWGFVNIVKILLGMK